MNALVSPGAVQRAVVLIWDGLRPDFVSPERTPTLAKLAARGVTFTRSHATFPSETRVNTASFSTGSWPTAHGIVANEMFHPAVNPDRSFSTGDAANLELLDRATDGRLLGVPSLGEVLTEAGGKLVAASGGSSGNAYLLNHRAAAVADPHRLALAHWGDSQPASLHQQILDRFGRAPARSVPNSGVCDWLTSIFCELLLQEYWAVDSRSVAVLWLSEPDISQHNAGIGSPAALQALRENDERLARVLATLDSLGFPALGPTATTALFVGSDHGFATVRGGASPEQSLGAAGLLAEDAVVTRAGVYLRNRSTERRDAIARYLLAQPWVGMVATRDGRPEGSIPLPLLQLDHPRAPDVAISYAWSDAPNSFGWPGGVASPSTLAGEHGGASPFEMHNTLIAAGPGFREGVQSDRPAGIVDLAPTILGLLGVPIPRRWMGRFLAELLAGVSPIAARVQERQEHEFATIVDGRRRLQRLFISRTDSGGYLDRAEVEW